MHNFIRHKVFSTFNALRRPKVIYDWCRTFILPSLLCLLEGLYHEPLIFFEFLPLASRYPPVTRPQERQRALQQSIQQAREFEVRSGIRRDRASGRWRWIFSWTMFFWWLKNGGGIGKKTCTKSAKHEASSDSCFGGVGLGDLIWHFLSHQKTPFLGAKCCRSWTFSVRNTLGPETLIHRWAVYQWFWSLGFFRVSYINWAMKNPGFKGN